MNNLKREKKIFLTVIIPCFNEEQNIKKGVLEGINKYLISKGFVYEVIISDDGSTDKSVETVRLKISKIKNMTLLENTHGGKPWALRQGISKAHGENILFTDMDQSTPIDQLDKLLPFIGDFPVIIGSRGLRRKNFPVYRRLGAAIFSLFRRLLILPEISDTQCGFKLFNTKMLKKSFPKLDFFKVSKKVIGWKVSSFDVELLHLLKKMGCRIKEIPVIWSDQDISANKGGLLRKYLKESWEMLAQIVKVKINDLKGLYND